MQSEPRFPSLPTAYLCFCAHEHKWQRRQHFLIHHLEVTLQSITKEDFHEFRDRRINAPLWIWMLDFTFLLTLFRTPKWGTAHQWVKDELRLPLLWFPISISFSLQLLLKLPAGSNRRWCTFPWLFASMRTWRMYWLAGRALLDFLQLCIWSTLANY